MYTRTDMMFRLSSSSLLTVTLVLQVELCTCSLHSHLRHFEVLSPRHLRTRTRRDVTTGQLNKYLNFRSLGRTFSISLSPGWRVVDPETLDTVVVRADGRWGAGGAGGWRVAKGGMEGQIWTQTLADWFKMGQI